MISIRQAYFEALELKIPKSIIYFALQEINHLSYTELMEHFDDRIRDYFGFKFAMMRYKNGEMIEYIFNKAYFLSTPFYVDQSVLIPRQETEQLVESTIKMINDKYPNGGATIADVCTGSGVIGLSIAKKLKGNKYYLSDISKEAIRVAEINKKRLELDDINILEGDMLSPFIEQGIKIDVLICNPPYIENPETIDEKTWNQEPHLALLAQPSTLFYEMIFKDYQKVMKDDFVMAFEIGEDMEKALTDLINKYMPSASFRFEKDMYKKTRFLFIEQK